MNDPDDSGNGPRIWLSLVAVAGSAVLFVLSFPPMRLRPLAWVALVPLFVTLRCHGARRAVTLAGLWGMLAAYGVTNWLPPAIANYYHQPVWLGMALFLTAAFLMGALDYMAFAGFYWWSARHGLRPLTLLAAAAWVSAELGRSRVLTGNPWGLVGYSQVGAGLGDSLAIGTLPHFAPLPLAQIADVTGVYGVTFVVVAVNAALAELWLRYRDNAAHRQRWHGRLWFELLAPSVLFILTMAYGVLRLSSIAGSVITAVSSTAAIGATHQAANMTANETGRNIENTAIAIVQGNLDLGSRWSSDLYGRNLDVYLELTERSAVGSAPRIVFWPENAMTFFVDEEPLYQRAIARTMAPLAAQLVAGAPRHEGTTNPSYFNSAFLLSPAGEILGRYDKQHLLPFAEYFPLGALGIMKRSFGRVREFSAGLPSPPLPTVAGPAGIVICNEAMFPRITRRRVTEGAAFLVNLANDSWIPSREFAEHQFDMASMRAIELRRYLVRASTSGPSGIIAPSGRVTVRSEPFSQGFVRGEIRPRHDKTVYARLGDLFAWLCLTIVASCWAFARRRGSGATR